MKTKTGGYEVEESVTKLCFLYINYVKFAILYRGIDVDDQRGD